MKLKTEHAQYVLDSSALIALVRGEPGSETVRAGMGASVVSAVNLTETMAKLIRAGGEPRLGKGERIAFSLLSMSPVDAALESAQLEDGRPAEGESHSRAQVRLSESNRFPSGSGRLPRTGTGRAPPRSQNPHG